MKPQEFCYWLQGWLEIENPGNVTSSQLQVIKNHLALVFAHEIDPSYTNLNPVDAQSIHDGGKPQIGGTVIGPDGQELTYRC